MKKTAAFLLGLCLLLSLTAPALAAEEVEYLPGVTEEMCSPAFWVAGMEDPDALLATAEDIARINRTALDTPGCNMHDLKGLPETFNGLARNESLPRGAAADAAYYLGWTYDSTGKKFTQEDFDAIIANTVDPNATESMPLGYGIAVNRALLVCFPYEGQILDDPADLDFDYQGLVGIRVNEPVAVFTTSADGIFYQVFTSSCSGWVRVEDIALCKDREEWLSAWDLPAEKRLVFCGDKLYTDYSKSSPETSCRLITMGTVLERMDELEFGTLVTNRQPLHNYAVYLPVRGEDGSYGKVPALVNARGPFSEDYLPLTGRNLSTVALASLGDAYGWGATLNNEDCSSLNRTVFTCFGLDLPRNENWQRSLPMPEADVSDMTAEEKLAILDTAPLGTILNFPGHQMMYLGKAEGEYFVVSTVSSIMNPLTGKRQRTRDVQINTLELRRANGKTWLQALNSMYIPWVSLEADEPLGPTAWYHEGTAYCLSQCLMEVYDGGFFRPQEAADRATAVEALWRVAGKPEPGGEVEPFPDVAAEASCASAAGWAREQGIIQGMNGVFAPEAPLTRQTLAVILYRWAGVQGLDTAPRAALEGFADGEKTADWAADAVRWAVGCGLLRGNARGCLEPGKAATRAELAVLLQRLSTLEAPAAESDFSGVTTEAVVAANDMQAVLARHQSLSMVYLDADGGEEARIYFSGDFLFEEIGQSRILLDRENTWQCDGWDGERALYYFWFAMDEAEKAEMRFGLSDFSSINAANTSREAILSIQDNGDGTLTVTTLLGAEDTEETMKAQGTYPEGYETVETQVEYVVERETLEIVSVSEALLLDGEATPSGSLRVTYDVDRPDDLDSFLALTEENVNGGKKDARTLRVVYDYGTETQQSFLLRVGQDVTVITYARFGYDDLYLDPERTEVYEWDDGSEAIIIYAFPEG